MENEIMDFFILFSFTPPYDTFPGLFHMKFYIF